MLGDFAWSEYIPQSILHSAIILLAVEVLLRFWAIRQADVRFVFRALPLLLPLAYLPVFWLAYPLRAGQDFREGIALIDLRRWSSLVPGGETTLAYALGGLLLMTFAVYLVQVGFLLGSRIRRPAECIPALAPCERLQRVLGDLPAFKEKSIKVLIADRDAPVLYAFGLRRQGIAISRWMVENLDEQELAGVLTHELVHLARRDNWMNSAMFALRTLTFYNPISLLSFHQLANEVELYCDSETVRLTGKPGAYSSALLKIYRWWEGVRGRRGLRNWRNWVFSGTETLEQESETKAIARRVLMVLEPSPLWQRTSYPRVCLACLAAGLLVLMFFVV